MRGKPSASLANRLASDERNRIAEQLERLGPDGLAEATRKLAEAKAEHDRPIPQETITSFNVPDVQTISWIPVQTKCDSPLDASRKDIDLGVHHKEGVRLPVFVQFEDVKVSLLSASLSLAWTNLIKVGFYHCPCSF